MNLDRWLQPEPPDIERCLFCGMPIDEPCDDGCDCAFCFLRMMRQRWQRCDHGIALTRDCMECAAGVDACPDYDVIEQEMQKR